ncbi:uncharacterized protein FIESC28_02167 [Fusarium coffeatum]|uniref:Uncharacterized protein n=1 Tax=Fusarium coffeatum TaxID=231269 RepID=A0A366S6U2_9HYPO|nr:uncharacterized protein FIESC28_02167 [Fusarium coffeatum]RBR25043.1 hypothetical protein FIESC28_02167 [Fusarium coffeatum]
MICNAFILAALAGSALAGPCKPGHTSSNHLSTKTVSGDTYTLALPSSETSIDIASQATDVPTTTNSLEGIIITNAVANGRLTNGIEGFDSEGEASHQKGGCFKDDGSPDDGCASLKAVGDSQKRFLGSFAGILQLL